MLQECRFFKSLSIDAGAGVCMPAICPPEILKKLQELAEESVTPEQRRERMDRGSQQQPFLRSSAIAKLATDPTVMWVLRQYLRTPAVR